MGKELQLSNNLDEITKEIIEFQKVTGQAIFEIGRRLKHVKENDLVHGEWENWCIETIEITPAYANRYIKVFDEFKNTNQYTSIGLNKLYQIATLPEEEQLYEFKKEDKIKEIKNIAKNILTNRQYIIFEFYYFNELTQQEIADLMGDSRSAIKMELPRIIEKIRRKIYI